MTKPLLLVVCGLPASGKSTLARHLGLELCLPVLVRDDIKTGMVEVRGSTSWTEPPQDLLLTRDSFGLFHELGLRTLRAGCGIVLEAAYHWPIAREELAPLRTEGQLVIVHCRAAPALLRDRYAGRFERGERHPCHRDGLFVERMDRGDYDWTFYDVPPDIEAPVITVDTTDGYIPAFEEICVSVRTAITNSWAVART